MSNGDLNCASPNPEELIEAINGTINTPVGCTKPELINALKLLPTPILLQVLVTNVL